MPAMSSIPLRCRRPADRRPGQLSNRSSPYRSHSCPGHPPSRKARCKYTTLHQDAFRSSNTSFFGTFRITSYCHCSHFSNGNQAHTAILFRCDSGKNGRVCAHGVAQNPVRCFSALEKLEESLQLRQLVETKRVYEYYQNFPVMN